MNFGKRFLAAALSAAMIIGCAGFAAAEELTAGEYVRTFVNDGGAPPRPTEMAGIMSVDREAYAQAAEILREGMKVRSPEIRVIISNISIAVPGDDEHDHPDDPAYDDGIYDIDDLCDDIFAVAVEHTGDPKEGDYIWRNLSGYAAAMSFALDRGGNVVQVEYTYYMEYLSSDTEEAKVDAKVAELLAGELNPAGKTDYDKIKSAYEWICAHVDYDNTLSCHSTYDALIDGSSVCQGYASLLYRLMLEMDIDCRYISGEGVSGGTSEPHGWNIVQLDGDYYFADSTWDTTYLDAGRGLNFFLRCAGDFVDEHIPNPEYDAAFWEEYHLSDYCYGGTPVTAVTVDKPSLDMSVGEAVRLHAGVQPTDAYCKTVIWSADGDAVSVDPATGEITALAPGTATVSAVAAGGTKADVAVTVAGEGAEYYGVDLSGASMPEEEGPFYAEVKVTKQMDRPGEDVIVMKMVDGEGKTVGIAYMRIAMEMGQTVTFGTNFTAKSGYELKAYVDDSIGADAALSAVSTL